MPDIWHALNCWMGTRAAQNWLLLANLVAVSVYVCLTRKIKNAAIEQTEGLSRPVVTAAFERNVPSVRGPSKLRLRNVGNGPALAVSWKLLDDPRQHSEAPCGEFAYIEAHGAEERAFDYSSSPMKYVVECLFEGASGSKYRSRTELSANGSPMTFLQTRI